MTRCNPNTLEYYNSKMNVTYPCIFDYTSKEYLPIEAMSLYMHPSEFKITAEDLYRCQGMTFLGKVMHVAKVSNCLGNKAGTFVKTFALPKEHKYYNPDDGDGWILANTLKEAGNNKYYIEQNFLSPHYKNEAMDIKTINTYALKDYKYFEQTIFDKLEEFHSYHDEL